MMIRKLRNWCFYAIPIVIIASNFINYFYSYKHLNDTNLQWRIAFYAIGINFLLYSFILWVDETLKRIRTLKRLVSGWVVIFSLFNLIGVIAGYNLHSKAFMQILFITFFLGVVHYLFRLWQKYC